MGTEDKGEANKAIVCWNCGTLIPLRIRIVEGKRVVVCACGKTNILDARA